MVVGNGGSSPTGIILEQKQVYDLLDEFRKAVELDSHPKSTHWSAAYEGGKMRGSVETFKKVLGVIGLERQASNIESEVYSRGSKESER